jgi:ACS family tartrate transporter-like MFS transporter
MNMIAIFGGFAGPYWMGLMKDATGNYQLGLRGLAIPCLSAAAIMFVLTQSLRVRVSARLREASAPAV